MPDDWALLANCGVCPVCRRVVRDDRPCDLDGSVVRSIVSPEDKQALIDAVWGPSTARDELTRHLSPHKRSARARVLSAVAVGSVGVVIGALLGDTSSGVALLMGLTGVMGAAFGSFLGTGRKQILIPTGGVPIATLPRFAVGRILPCDVVLAPGSDTECAAWALELRYDGSWGSRTTLRVGASAGFKVALDGGEQVRIPAGPLWIHDALPQLPELEAPSLEELLRVLDVTRTHRAESWPLFQYNIVGERTLHIGDRVEILGAVDRELVSGNEQAMYRDAPPSVLVPRAVPALRLVS